MNWIAWSLLSALFAGVTAILAKQGVTHIPSNLAMAIRTTVIFAVAWAVVLASGPPAAIAKVDRRGLLFLVLSGGTTGLSWLCYFRALQVGEASRVAPLDKLSVVFVVLFAALFLGERLTFLSAAGVLLIAAGAILLTFA
ncbi:MAG TPA: EamA family transporter [Bryobacteraceae bacterium]|nr:EamA family transporter [Bryobacteraceae bacterium]